MASNIAPIPKREVRSRNKIEQHEHEDAADARRVLNVDEDGNPYNDGNPFPVEATVSGESRAKTPHIFVIDAINAGQEYSQILPENTAQIKLQCRKSGPKIRVAYTANATKGDEYWTVKPGNDYREDNKKLIGKVIYFQTNKSNQKIIILAWTF
jgi:hypothetical protein